MHPSVSVTEVLHECVSEQVNVARSALCLQTSYYRNFPQHVCHVLVSAAAAATAHRTGLYTLAD